MKKPDDTIRTQIEVIRALRAANKESLTNAQVALVDAVIDHLARNYSQTTDPLVSLFVDYDTTRYFDEPANMSNYAAVARFIALMDVNAGA